MNYAASSRARGSKGLEIISCSNALHCVIIIAKIEKPASEARAHVVRGASEGFRDIRRSRVDSMRSQTKPNRRRREMSTRGEGALVRSCGASPGGFVAL